MGPKMLIALSLCAAISLACTVTRAAGVRRMAEARLKSCHFTADCYTQVKQFCREQGLEKTCGEGWQP